MKVKQKQQPITPFVLIIFTQSYKKAHFKHSNPFSMPAYYSLIFLL